MDYRARGKVIYMTRAEGCGEKGEKRHRPKTQVGVKCSDHVHIDRAREGRWPALAAADLVGHSAAMLTIVTMKWNELSMDILVHR